MTPEQRAGHDVTVSAAECAECKRDDTAECMSFKVKSVIHRAEQQSALYAAAGAAFGPEPIRAILALRPEPTNDVGLHEFQGALRAQMEAKK